ncbi:type II secretion system protein [Methylomonas rapida]|uniref:Type II secretion system protein n=1 Tax=Methylomonas rapida TaxID=2963939 RepID=A0ABY7GL23_9GAMM|nr:type II secretion system protein [Methylomonas rapida]WAR45182.1 type II secretion system protein [Methylomonas rapida]
MAHSEFPFTPCGVRGSVGARSRGFTLLEMLLVIFLMALVASAGLMLTEGVEDQAKYDETKRRMELIRKAIVGDPTRTVNGAPEISGFVADMGRLPGCWRELLEPSDCNDQPLKEYSNGACVDSTFTNESDCQDAGKLWVPIAFGWRGPYISVVPDHDGVRRFRDGYGNEDIDDDLNFGWVWRMYDADDEETSNPDEAVLIRIKSKGFDGQEDSSDDYPNDTIANVTPLIDSRDHQVKLDNWSGRVLFINRTSNPVPPNPADTFTLKLKLNYPDGNGGVGLAVSNTFTLSGSDPIPAGASDYSPPITFSDGKTPPLGMHTLEVLCDDDTEFTNSCPGDSDHDRFGKISMLPFSQSTEFNLIWDIDD